jgi:hypothetical protein
MDKELKAMGQILKILAALDEAARTRVWKWIDHKLCELPTEAVIAVEPAEAPDGPQG